ncbi:hypothetical protein GS887_25690 [Rhodococcus hoagii]|nr:hypothetical protein [Prescottella equi]NKR23351.1 hypothetical protein [Prescottella equi]NKU37338.1 hypothetical protein [Prescottella equi]NKZ79789.1 hypothetical protein [Prescottella equi]
MVTRSLARVLLCAAVATPVTVAVASPATAAGPPPVTYEQSTVLALGRGERATDVAVDAAGNTAVLVSSRGTNIVRISADGQRTTTPLSGIAGGAGGIAVDDDGNTFLASARYSGGSVPSGEVVQITPYGETLTILSGLRNPCDIAANGSEVAVLDCGTGNEDGYVVRADLVGGGASQSVHGFVQPRGLALDDAGNILIGEARYGDGNSTVVKVARDGTRTEIPLDGIFPHRLAVTDDGLPVVAGVTETAPRVVRLGDDGSQTVLPFSGLVWPTGVAAAPNGVVTVSYLEGSSTDSASRVVRLVPQDPPTPSPEPTPTPTPTPGFGSSGS